MKIAITGSNGFIAKNLIYRLITDPKIYIFRINRKTSKKYIDQVLDQSDIVFHFAGANRENKKQNFQNDNVKFTRYICDYLSKKNIKKKIVFSSSVQATLNNKYGKSKRKCEDILKNFAKKHKSGLVILRLPNIFGKWSRPNYNSAVSTFCYNISRGNRNKLINPKKILSLLYIDDLVDNLFKLIKDKNNKIKIISDFKKIKKISVQNLFDKITSFEQKRNLFYIDEFKNNFTKNLYSTYVYFLPKNKIKYNLINHKDKRGSFVEFLKTNLNGQFSIFKAKNNQIRGYHFHHSKVEKFLVVSGKAKFHMKDISSNKKLEYKLDHKIPTVIETIPGWQHYIKNIGKNELIVLLWSNEVYNVKKPDTYQI